MDYKSKIVHYLGKTKEGLKEAWASRSWPDRPEELNIELTSICDSKCIHCPRENMDRPMRAMDFDLFKRIVDEAAELKIPTICPNGYGEISTIKDKEKYFEYIRSKDHDFEIVINTNGFRMDEATQELYIKHRVSLLNICIDGATAPTAEKVRKNLKLPQIEGNILNLMRIRKERGLDYPKIRAGFVIIPENEHEKAEFVEKWRDKVDYVGVDGYSNRGGSLESDLELVQAENEKKSMCVLPFKTMNVWANGQVVICCEDWNASEPVGNANDSSITEIWRGEDFRRIRQSHLDGKGNCIGICANCNYWKEPKLGSLLKAG